MGRQDRDRSIRPTRLTTVLAVLLALVAALIPVAAEPAAAQFSSVRINEFLAANETGRVDNTGEFEDWIELYNGSGATVDLGGWTIQAGGDSFTFSSGFTIGASQFRVVVASGDTSRTTGSELHLPFKLSAGGELLELRNAGGGLTLPAWPAPGYPSQSTDISYGISSGGTTNYFVSPTPGSVNGGGVSGRVEPVTFSVDHGYYSSTQSVTLSTSTPSATIRYTLNGSTPTSSNGIAIAPGQSISVSSTSIVRAIAYRSGWIDSSLETRSYLFASDIANQSSSVPSGWPASAAINGQVMNYGMDPGDVAGGSGAVQSALQSIPSISVTTDLDNLFDPTDGIYVNASERGRAWERPASIELIDPTGAESGFEINGGLRIRGGFSRSINNPKHSFRLFFRNDYGDGRLDYPLFGAEGTDEYAKVDLRTSQNYGWGWRGTADATYIDELWSRDTQAAMGQPYTRTRMYHLFLNGQYWGLYQTQERVSGEYGEAYLGGDEDDFDVVKRAGGTRETEATEGNAAAWQSLRPLVSDLFVTDSEYAVLNDQVDLANLADYYLLHYFSGDFDGAPSWFFRSPDNTQRWVNSNNWYAARNRNGVGDAGKWLFFDHDSEHSLCANNGPTMDHTVNNTAEVWNLTTGGYTDALYFSPPWLHQALLTHPSYQQIFIDRVQLHMVNPGGALSIQAATDRLNARAAQVEPAIDAHAARWGDATGVTYDKADWQGGVQKLRDCFVDRYPVVQQQLQSAGLWPSTSSPVISPVAGAVPFGTDVTIAPGGSGNLWVTLDGSDPRGVNGQPSPTSFLYGGAISITDGVTVRARLDSNGNWSPLAEAAYTLSTPAGPVRLALNEFNAVGSGSYLGGGGVGDVANGVDDTFGRLLGNGGDWFELVVVEDNLDIRGWTVEVWDASNGLNDTSAELTFASSNVLSNLRSGSLITISESIGDDISYNPAGGDWNINLQSDDLLSGAHFTSNSQGNFAINSQDTQIAIRDNNGTLVALRTGEGTVPGVSISSNEIFKLEGPPTTSLTNDSALYNDGSSSTWGLPNRYGGGANVQDLSGLRVIFGDADCSGAISLLDARNIAQYAIGQRTLVSSCPLTNVATQTFGPAADIDGDNNISLLDARAAGLCSIGVAGLPCS